MAAIASAITPLASRAPLRMRGADHTTKEHESESSGDDYSDGEGETTAVDEVVEDNYVRKTLAKEKPLPPITFRNVHKNLNVVSTLALTVVPALAFYGAMNVAVDSRTVAWAILYYYFTGLGITAGTSALESPIFLLIGS